MGTMLAGAMVGAIQNQEKERAESRQNKMRAKMNRFSDVTGRFQNLKHDAPSQLSGALQGGFAGAKFAKDNPSEGGGGSVFSKSDSPGGGGIFSGLFDDRDQSKSVPLRDTRTGPQRIPFGS